MLCVAAAAALIASPGAAAGRVRQQRCMSCGEASRQPTTSATCSSSRCSSTPSAPSRSASYASTPPCLTSPSSISRRPSRSSAQTATDRRPGSRLPPSPSMAASFSSTAWPTRCSSPPPPPLPQRATASSPSTHPTSKS